MDWQPIVAGAAMIPTVALVLWAAFFDPKPQLFKSKDIYVTIGEYQQYETADSIDCLWHDYSLVGECGFCGCDDAPIVIKSDPCRKAKCKWCAELDNLNYHLRHNGVRRLRGYIYRS